jgi:phosphate acetyltransferase
MSLFQTIRRRAAEAGRTVVYPESGNAAILRTADAVAQLGIAHPILVGDPDTVRDDARALGLGLSGVEVCLPEEARIARYADRLLEGWRAQGTRGAEARARLADPVWFGAAMVGAGDADTVVCGISIPSAAATEALVDCIGPCTLTSVLSRYFLADSINATGTPGMLVADANFLRTPSATELAEIALGAAESVSRILESEPRVAFVFFTAVASLGQKNRFKSAAEELGERVVGALRTIQARDEKLRVERELRRGVRWEDVNTLVFADHQAGNIGYTLGRELDGARVVGPMIHGLAHPAAVVSAGTSVDDLIDLTALTALTAQQQNRGEP